VLQIAVRRITLGALGGWVDMCPSSMSSLMHRIGRTPREAHVRRIQEAGSHAEPAL
jgi:hypothetical protein